MKEHWKPIIGFNLYEVSDKGHVKSHYKNRHKRPHILIPEFNRQTGYLRVSLYKNGKRKRCKVHRLVASAFLPNPKNKPEVNHKDFNKINCCVENLEWATSSENTVHSVKAGRQKNLFGSEQRTATLAGRTY